MVKHGGTTLAGMYVLKFGDKYWYMYVASIYDIRNFKPNYLFLFFFSSRRRHTRSLCDWSSDVCSSDLRRRTEPTGPRRAALGLLPHPRRRSVRPHVAADRRAAPGARALGARAVVPG